jgi:predicted nucleic acid-binding protein
MKRILFDTNVVLDVLLDRKPWAEMSAAVWSVVESGSCEGMLAAHAVTTIHYMLRKENGSAGAKRVISAILRVFRVAAIDGAVLGDALQLPFSDFEDAVTAAAARLANCDYIVTRDPKGFRGSPVPPFTPEAILPLFEKTARR